MDQQHVGGEHYIEGMTPAVVAMLKKVAEESAKRTMEDSLKLVGIDITNPIQAQQEFALLRKLSAAADDEDQIADRLWVRKQRLRSEGLSGKIWTAAIGVGVLNFFWLLGTGIKTVMTQLPAPPPH